MDFQSLQNDLKDWLKEKARVAASAARSVDSKVQRVENYLGITRSTPTPNPITSPKAFLKDQLITKPVQSVKNIVNPVLTGLNVATSFPLGGSVRSISEVKKGTYQAPKTGVKIMGIDAGNFINPAIVGAVRGITKKQTLFEEVPKAAGVKNPVGAFALGLASELVVPGPGGKGKALEKVKNALNADNLSKILSNSLKLNPAKIADKPNRLVGERWSFQEAMTGLTQTGKNLKGRILLGMNDAKQLVLEDGTHLLEAYRQLRKPVPMDKIAFTSDKAKKVFERLAKRSGNIIENITQVTKPIQERIDQVLEKTKLNEKTIRAGFTRAINTAKSQEDAAKNILGFIDRIYDTGDQKLKEAGMKAINAQLARFEAFKGNKKAASLFQALEDGFAKLQDVPFGPKGMYDRPFAPRATADKAESFTEIINNVDPARVIRFPRIASAVDQLKDLSSLRPGWSDFDRNFEKVFTKGSEAFNMVKEEVLDPFIKGKSDFVDEAKQLTDELESTIVKGLGIGPGSKLSALVQQYGEKRMSLSELQQTVPKEWQKVVKADEWFRGMYDKILGAVNEARAKIYPNNPEKIIPRRDDYYRHFVELSDTFAGLKNILSGPNNIAPSLAGVSDFTKPKSRWASFMQARTGDRTKLDAVGGFVDYIKAALYAKHVDPTIDNFLGLAQDLRQVTDKGGPVLNNFVEYLSDFAGRLAGKTNPLDRGIQKGIPGGRTTMKALNWMNQNFKVNAILGNISSIVNQTLSLPLGVADAGPINATKGAYDALANIFREGASIDSKFLKERYLDSAFDRFDVGMVNNAKKSAKWMLTSLEELSTRFIWNAEYNRALSKGIDNAVEAADTWTKKVVAGRGIGEVPLMQDSKVFQMAMPFQVEVANMWLLFKDWVDAKEFGKFVTFAIGSNVLVNALEKITGQRTGFDPLGSLSEGLLNTIDDKGEGENVGPLIGDLLSNIPGAQYPVRVLPADVREKIFGSKDPARYDRFGTGIPLASGIGAAGDVVATLMDKGLSYETAKEAAKFYTTFFTPFGGSQMKKTAAGATMLFTGGRYNDNGELQFPTDPDLTDRAKALVFGPYANDNAKLYFDQQLKPLTAKETQFWEQKVKAGGDPTKEWLKIQEVKMARGLRERVNDIGRDPSLSREEKLQKAKEEKMRYDATIQLLRNYQP